MKDEKVNVKLGGEMVLPVFDCSQYIGKKGRIANVETFKGVFGYYLKVTSTVIDVLKGKDKKEVVASRIFSLYTDEKGVIGWGSTSKLAEYLLLKRVSSPNELLGKEIVIQTSIKEGKEFLTFV